MRKGRNGHNGEVYHTLLAVALELTVVEEGAPTYIQAHAWVNLVKRLWALRHDDLQWLSPADVAMHPESLQATRTKTTGPGKLGRQARLAR